MLRLADLHESNHQLESRVREIRLPGSEGGALVTNVPTPIRIDGRAGSSSLPILVLLSDRVAEHADLLDLDFDHITRP